MDEFSNVDWEAVLKRLFGHAKTRLERVDNSASTQDVEDLAHEALRQLLDPDYKTRISPGDNQHDVIQKLGSIVNGLVRNRVRKMSAQSFDPTEPIISEALAEDRSVEVTLAQREEARRILNAIEDATLETEDELGMEVLTRIEQPPREMAEELSVDVKEVYNAKRRLRERAKRSVSQSRGHDDQEG